MAVHSFTHELPGLTVCISAYRSAGTIKEAILSADRVLSGLKWALVLCIDGHEDNTGAVAKGLLLSAFRVHIEQFPKARTIHESCNRAFAYARALRYECPYFTVLDADDLMLPGRVDLFRECVRHGHDVLIGGAWAMCGDELWDHETAKNYAYGANALHLAVFRAALLEHDYRLCPEDVDHDTSNDTMAWHLLKLRGIVPGVWPGLRVTEYHMASTGHSLSLSGIRGKYEKTVEWLRARPVAEPEVTGIIAAGPRYLREARVACASYRLHHQNRLVVLTDAQGAKEVEAWKVPNLEVWSNINSFLRVIDNAMVHYWGPDWGRGIFRYASMKPAFARQLGRFGSILLADSDMVFLRPLGPLPRRPAATVDPTGWHNFGFYSSHHWGLSSAGLLWIPAHHEAFVARLDQLTLENIRAYRNETSLCSMPRNGNYCEQGAWETLMAEMNTTMLHPGHNLTPSCVREVDNYLMTFNGIALMKEASRTIGLVEDSGLWWRGWPVKSVHCHLGTESYGHSFGKILLTHFGSLPESDPLLPLLAECGVSGFQWQGDKKSSPSS